MTSQNWEERRAGKRAKQTLSVRLQGADARGVAFEESVHTADVSSGGLCVLTARDLDHGAVMTITVAGQGQARPGRLRSDFQAQALVVYVLKEGALNRVGIRFVAATLPMPGG